MKISDMTNDQATEAMIRLCGPFSNICDDEEALKIIDEINGASKKDPNMHPIRQWAAFLPKLVTFALQKHKNDLYEIIGALTMQSAAKVGRMNFKETLKIIKDSYDDILASFFTQSAAAEKNRDIESA